MTNRNSFVFFGDIVALYSENLTKPINTLCEQIGELVLLNVKAVGT
jgi:hypothetical protein